MFHDVICSILCFLCRCIICWCGRFLGFLRAWQEICVCCYCAVGEVYQKTFRATVFFLATTPRKILLHSSYHLSQQWFSATSKPPRTWSSWMQIWCRCWSSCNLRTARPETTRCHHALIKMISVTSPQPATSNLVERPLVTYYLSLESMAAWSWIWHGHPSHTWQSCGRPNPSSWTLLPSTI